MNSLSVTNEQFSDILNLYYGSYFPLKHFNDEKNFKNIGYVNCFLLRMNSLQLDHIIIEKSIKNGGLRFVTGLSRT